MTLRFIAEAGINHNGSLVRACEMADTAKWAGADTIKFQCLDPNHHPPDRVWQGYNMRSLLEDCALKPKEWIALKAHCERQDMRFLCTPQTVKDFEFLLTLGIDEVKISSDNLGNLELLEAVNRARIDSILSTGMANWEDIKIALHILHPRFALVCTSEYPCPPEGVNISRLWRLKGICGYNVGLSDHTIGSMAGIMAVVYGALVIEKHFTLDQNLPGPDHSWSHDPRDLKWYFEDLRNAEKMMGSGEFKPTEAELELKQLLGV